MINLIQFKDRKIWITEEALYIKSFRNLWERDKSKDKSIAINELGYVYFMNDPRSEYMYLTDLDERKKIITEQEGFPSKWKPDAAVEDAEKDYRIISKTTSSLLLSDLRVAIDKVRKFLVNVDLSKRDKKDKPIYSINQIMAAIKQIPELIKEVDEAEHTIANEMKNDGSMIGNKEKKLLEDGFQGI